MWRDSYLLSESFPSLPGAKVNCYDARGLRGPHNFMTYRNDLDAAHNRIHSLEGKIAELNRKPKLPKEKKVKCKTCGGLFHRMGASLFGIMAGIIVAGSVVGLVGYPAFMSIFNSETQGCYIRYDTHANRHKLMQTITWRTDRDMGEYKTAKDAIKEAEVLNCPLEPVSYAPTSKVEAEDTSGMAATTATMLFNQAY